VLEGLELAPFDAASAARLGTSLAAQHRLPQARFGWGRDNFIGASPQVNGWSDDWLEFWRAQRLHPQLRLAAHGRLPSRMIDRGERLMADCHAFFRTYSPAKSLLHGDLWSGNAASLQGGVPVAFDPAVYVGDREADVAMTELFGGFPRDFFSAYRAAWPLDDGYPVRREFYNLYHRLNHANLFAGRYVRDSEHAIERLLAEVA
jgi:protein-ribulosamine 3-kinase